MADRRMLAKTIIESDAFSCMPPETQMLYVRLNMAADDDGFVSNPRQIMRGCGATEDSMKLLIAKKFVLSFEYGDNFIFLIKHWKIHNYIQKDRYKASAFRNLLREVYLDENKAYSMTPGPGKQAIFPPASDTKCIQHVSNMDTDCIQDVSKMDTQDRLGKSKDRVGKESIGKSREGEDNNSFSKIAEGKGVQGENQRRPAPSPLSGEAREKRIAEFRDHIQRFKNLGFDAVGMYNLAASEGISAEEIDAEEGETP